MATAAMSKAPQANHKVLLAALLCAAAASFLPVSSAAAPSPSPSPLVSQTCFRTSNPGLCLRLLRSSNRSSSSAATTARDLAAVAVTAARWAVLRAQDAVRGARGTGPGAYLVARCAAQYSICLGNTGRALGWVDGPEHDNGTVFLVSNLRRFPEKCESLFHEARIASPLEKVNRDTEETVIVVSEIIINLLR